MISHSGRTALLPLPQQCTRFRLPHVLIKAFHFVFVFIFIFDRGHAEGGEVVCILLIAQDRVACPILHPVFVKLNTHS